MSTLLACLPLSFSPNCTCSNHWRLSLSPFWFLLETSCKPSKCSSEFWEGWWVSAGTAQGGAETRCLFLQNLQSGSHLLLCLCALLGCCHSCDELGRSWDRLLIKLLLLTLFFCAFMVCRWGFLSSSLNLTVQYLPDKNCKCHILLANKCHQAVRDLIVLFFEKQTCS